MSGVLGACGRTGRWPCLCRSLGLGVWEAEAHRRSELVTPARGPGECEVLCAVCDTRGPEPRRPQQQGALGLLAALEAGAGGEAPAGWCLGRAPGSQTAGRLSRRPHVTGGAGEPVTSWGR